MVSKVEAKYTVKIEFETIFVTNNTKENIYLNGDTEIQPTKKAKLDPGFELNYLTLSAGQDAVKYWNFKENWTVNGKQFAGQLSIEPGLLGGTFRFNYGAGGDQFVLFRKEGSSIKLG
ncbi:hypothetical protein H0H93_012581 [Arthromyces matolae]|nr:hypothetical protein H0H93_012581 [Arthromyces matolae]